MYTDIIATYDYIDGKMVHDGYFIYGNGVTLKWVSIKDVREV